MGRQIVSQIFCLHFCMCLVRRHSGKDVKQLRQTEVLLCGKLSQLVFDGIDPRFFSSVLDSYPIVIQCKGQQWLVIIQQVLEQPCHSMDVGTGPVELKAFFWGLNKALNFPLVLWRCFHFENTLLVCSVLQDYPKKQRHELV